MALTYDQISAITEKYFIPKLADNIFRSNALTDRLIKQGRMDIAGGERILAPALYAQSTTQWFSGAETLDSTDVEQMTSFEFLWKQLQSPISITRIDELKNSGDAAKLIFVKEKVKAAEISIRQALGDGIHNAGTDSSQIVGLRAIVDDNNTYGGIDRSVYSWAQAQEDLNTTTTFSVAALQSLTGDCTEGTEMPSVYISTQAIYNRYYGSLQPAQRFQDSDSAKGGFTTLMFNGKPFIVDSKTPANHLYALNENFLKLCVHKDENFRFRPFMEEARQAVKVARVFLACALVCNNPRFQGAFKGMSA
jgi:hypothetical protein